jgi:ribosomal protein S18 acetylase RimI-like enzyme
MASDNTCAVTDVRPAQTGDLAAVAALVGEFRDFWGRTEPTAEQIEQGVTRLHTHPDAEFLLAPPSRGFALIRFRYVVWTHSEECELEDLYVRDSERRSGLGRMLTGAAIERARERGCVRMNISANDANGPAIALYRALGFSAWHDPPGGHNLSLRRSL